MWVKVLDAKRTFWEKATILHQYAHLPKDKKLPARISRHYYDFFSLLNSDVKADAIAELELLDRVTAHKSIYFASAWASYGTARNGSLKLSPPTMLLDGLEKDFSLMRDMFFGNVPEWSNILKGIEDFEVEFNQGSQNMFFQVAVSAVTLLNHANKWKKSYSTQAFHSLFMTYAEHL